MMGDRRIMGIFFRE